MLKCFHRSDVSRSQKYIEKNRRQKHYGKIVRSLYIFSSKKLYSSHLKAHSDMSKRCLNMEGLPDAEDFYAAHNVVLRVTKLVLAANFSSIHR